jgi:hypothetical protein
VPVVLNTPFTLLTTLGKPSSAWNARTWRQMQADAALAGDATWSSLLRTRRPDEPCVPARPNVVVIVLESFSAPLYSARLTGG